MILDTLSHLIQRLYFRLSFRLEVEGEEYIPTQGGFVLAGNEIRLLDILLTAAALRNRKRFIFISHDSRPSLLKSFLRLIGIAPVDVETDQTGPDEIARCLKAGEVCIYPHRKLTTGTRLEKFDRILRESNCPVVPFVIQRYHLHNPWRWIRPFPEVMIQFGQSLSPDGLCAIELAHELRNRIRFMKAALERREFTHRFDIQQDSLLALIQYKADIHGGHSALMKWENGEWHAISYIELSRQARDLSCWMMEQGINIGDRVAILSESRTEWGVALFAALHTGCIVVPLDAKLTFDELHAILSDCKPAALFASAENYEKARHLQDTLDDLKQVILMNHNSNHPDIPDISYLKPEQIYEGIDRRLDDDMLIVYTSGTTGQAKGVVLTCRNVIYEARTLGQLMKLDANDVFLSTLPLNHLLELTCGFLSALHAGARIYYSDSLFPHELLALIREKNVTYMITVPLFLKMARTHFESELKKLSPSERKLFKLSYALARFIPWMAVKKLLFKRVHQKLGSRFKGFVSGGAPLELETAEFFHRLGITIYQGYGLTETAPVISVNAPGSYRAGSVGKPMPGISIRLSAEGEILTRGPHLMRGYYQRPDLTGEVIDEDGWLHTGDLGRMDPDGFLYITGRTRNLIVLSGGKKVHPEEVETVLLGSDKIKEVCVLGLVASDGLQAGTEQVYAVIVPEDTLREKLSTEREMVTELLNREIAGLSQSLASYKRPVAVRIVDAELPKTATRKLKRAEVRKLFESDRLEASPA